MVDVLISIDTTGSMYPCLSQLRTKVVFLTEKLRDNIPDLRLAIIGHGDYCTRSSYVTKHIDFSSEWDKITSFIDSLGETGGVWDDGEAYEQVLCVANGLKWRPGSKKIMVVTGDDIPHPPFFEQNVDGTDWRFETQRLRDIGVRIFAVQCLGFQRATFFYKELAEITKGHYLPLDQFYYITDLLVAVVFNEQSVEAVESYEQEMISENRYNTNMRRVVNKLLNREEKTCSLDEKDQGLEYVNPSRFQVLDVTESQSIKQFVQSFGIVFKTGRGFYELTKRETISPKKEIVLMDPVTGSFYSGPRARELLKLPADETIKVSPDPALQYIVFVKSTSYNRKLIGGTRFLYEVQLV